MGPTKLQGQAIFFKVLYLLLDKFILVMDDNGLPMNQSVVVDCAYLIALFIAKHIFILKRSEKIVMHLSKELCNTYVLT